MPFFDMTCHLMPCVPYHGNHTDEYFDRNEDDLDDIDKRNEDNHEEEETMIMMIMVLKFTRRWA